MKIGMIQFSPIFGEPTTNLAHIISQIDALDADLIVLPELPFTGYMFRDREELISLSEEPQTSIIVRTLTGVCREKHVFIVTGFAEKSGNKYYNSSLLIGPNGLISVYRKLHLFMNEKSIFDPGNLPLSVHQVKDAYVGMMICFDWIFPEVSRSLSLLGADILCHPSNLVLNYCQNAMVTRSIENQVYAVTVNRYGQECRPHGDVLFTGQSQMTDPKGNILHQCAAQKDENIVVDIDISVARDKHITEWNHVITDRRPQYYQEIIGEDHDR
ncbi:MAG: acyltransferase [Candidatus Marinimicrobia bacterium]|nr:acyltransferase [Candidatus Neomarinimicrobiota bacterium]MBL7059917.1 acyltransferase [Candidatus Neomarinimicrobiota bacterium]